MVQRSAGGPGKVDRRDRQARTSYEPSRAARDAAGVSGAQDRRGDRRRPPACGPQHHRNDPENRTAPALERATASSGTPIDSRGRSCLRQAFFPRTASPQNVGWFADGHAKIANREFCANFALSRRRWHSPRPRLRVNRAPRADFIASPNCRETCQTGWRMTQSDSNPSRREKFPVTGKNTGNFINREGSMV